MRRRSVLRSLILALIVGAMAFMPSPVYAQSSEPVFQLLMPDSIIDPRADVRPSFALRVTEPIEWAHIRVTMDLSRVAEFGIVQGAGGDCGMGTNHQLFCDTTMSMTDPPPPAAFWVGAIRVIGSLNGPAVGRVVWSELKMTVNDVELSRQVAFVFKAANGSHDLAAIGATVATDSAAQKRIKVGVKNVGNNPWFTLGEPPLIANITLPANTRAKSVSSTCQSSGTRKYACETKALDPGQTAWFEINLTVDPDKPVSTGHITVVDGADSNPANDTATIKVSGSSLPVTGPRTWVTGTAGASLVILGVLLVLGMRRRAVS